MSSFYCKKYNEISGNKNVVLDFPLEDNVNEHSSVRSELEKLKLEKKVSNSIVRKNNYSEFVAFTDYGEESNLHLPKNYGKNYKIKGTKGINKAAEDKEHCENQLPEDKTDLENADFVTLENNDFNYVPKETTDTVGKGSFIKSPKTSQYFAYITEVHCQITSDENGKEMAAQEKRNKEIQNDSNIVNIEDDDATEKLRKHLLHGLDLELAKMKEDGFIDEDENARCEETSENIENKYMFQEKTDENQENESVTDDCIFSNNDFYKETDSCNENNNMVMGEIYRNFKKSRRRKYGKFFKNVLKFDQHELVKDEAQSETEDDNTQITNKKGNIFQNNLECLFDFETFNMVQNEESQNIFKEVHEVIENSKDIESNVLYQNIYELEPEINDLNQDVRNTSPVKFEDEFCETPVDYFEKGSYFVEAYNKSGSELIITHLSAQKEYVNLDTPLLFERLKKNINNSDTISEIKEDKMLSPVDDIREFDNESSDLASAYSGADSNRSTLYSTTSMDDEEDDEGISVSNNYKKNECDDIFNSVKRKTFSDQKRIVNFDKNISISPRRNKSTTQRGKLSYIIDEIKSTEIKYVNALCKVVNEYKPNVESRLSIFDHQEALHYIFGNIEILLQNQAQFLTALLECGEEVEDITNTFIKNEKLFMLYPNYFKDKTRTSMYLAMFSAIIKQAQEALNERLDLPSYLLTPLQRLGKYKLFLENIEKELIKLDLPTHSAKAALKIIKTAMSKGNDYVAIDSIMNSPISMLDYGLFKMREEFVISKPRRMEVIVFLFENVIVFTYRNPDRPDMDTYLYLDSIKTDDLAIATNFEDLTIHLTDFTKKKRLSDSNKYTFILEAKTDYIKDAWTKEIENILWQQLYEAKATNMIVDKTSKTSENKKAELNKTLIRFLGKRDHLLPK